MNNNLNEFHPLGDLNANLKETIKEAKEALNNNFAFEAKLVNDQKELIKESFNSDIEFIKSLITSIPQKIRTGKAFIGKASKNGVDKLVSFYSQTVSIKQEAATSMANIEPNWKELEEARQKVTNVFAKVANQASAPVAPPALEPRPGDVPVTMEDIEKDITMQTTAIPVFEMPKAVDTSNLVEENAIPNATPYDQTEIIEAMGYETKPIVEEHPINVVDAFKNFVEEKKLSFEAWTLSGQIKIIETKNIVINKFTESKNNAITKIDSAKKDLISKAFYSNQDKRQDVAVKVETKKEEISDLQNKLAALKAMNNISKATDNAEQIVTHQEEPKGPVL